MYTYAREENCKWILTFKVSEFADIYIYIYIYIWTLRMCAWTPTMSSVFFTAFFLDDTFHNVTYRTHSIENTFYTPVTLRMRVDLL